MAGQKGMFTCLLAALVWSASAGGNSLRFPRPDGQDDKTSGSQMQETGFTVRAATESATVCPAGPDPGNPDWGKGKDSEGTSYGYAMMQADSPELTSAANTDNVLFCIILAGVDITNLDIPKSTTGCMPGTSRPGGPVRQCYNWTEELYWGHGTRSAAAIGGLKNGVGVVGIMPGAQMYIYRLWNDPENQEPILNLLDAYKDCVAELDVRESAKSTSHSGYKGSKGSSNDMKLVILTDDTIVIESANDTADVLAIGDYIKSVTTDCHDVMFIQAAYLTGTSVLGLQRVNDSFPGAYPEYITLSAVDSTFTWAGEAQDIGYNPKTPEDWDNLLGADLSAPGVDILMSQPRGPDFTHNSVYGQPSSSVVVSPPLTGEQPDLWNAPPPAVFDPSGTGKVTAGLAYCGLANNGTCDGVQGKICLIQRGDNTFGEKVTNCIAGGGVGAMIYARDDQPECERMLGYTLVPPTNATGPLPDGTWPITVGISLKQGQALLAALKAGNKVIVTLTVSSAPNIDDPLWFMTCNCAAASLAAGAIGKLWSAHPECSAQQIRAAVEETAKPKQDPNQSKDILMKKYGKGLVQVQDAHTYLQHNPCKPTPIIAITTSFDNSHGYSPRHYTPGQPSQSTQFTVTVKVTSADGEAMKGVKVGLNFTPNGLASCSYSHHQSRTTDRRGAVNWRCKAKSGQLAITAAVAESKWYEAASKTITVEVP